MNAAPTRVLLVEPHADTRELYAWGLSTAGFDVQTADDGTSATLALAIHTPAIVVSETRLPDVAALFTRCSEEGVPVIALTTNPFWQPDTFGAVGVACVLLKPCLPDEVGSTIRGVLGLSPRRVSRCSSRHHSCSFCRHGTAIRIPATASVDCR